MMAETQGYRVTSILRVRDKAAPLLQGFDTLPCEASNTLPTGVFYGLVDGAHPVIGRTDVERPNGCQLTLLTPGAETDAIAAGKPLAVLGMVRGSFVEPLWEDDVHWAQEQFLARAPSFT